VADESRQTTDVATKAIIGLQQENRRLRETLQRVVWLWREDNVRSMRERGDDMADISEGILNAKF
jgi:hypothetical protein